MRSGWGTEKDVIIDLNKNITKPISHGYNCNNFAISVLKNKVLKIYRFG